MRVATAECFLLLNWFWSWS